MLHEWPVLYCYGLYIGNPWSQKGGVWTHKNSTDARPFPLLRIAIILRAGYLGTSCGNEKLEI